jgi:hypothetical protein
MSSVETRLDGSTLIVRIPMRFQRRGGRKRIMAPDGSEIVRARSRSPTGRWSRHSRGVAVAETAGGRSIRIG